MPSKSRDALFIVGVLRTPNHLIALPYRNPAPLPSTRAHDDELLPRLQLGPNVR